MGLDEKCRFHYGVRARGPTDPTNPHLASLGVPNLVHFVFVSIGSNPAAKHLRAKQVT